jgi:hypothetical protein
VGSADAKPVVEATSTHGGDCARLAPERNEEAATGERRKGFRAGRQGKILQTADCRFGARGLVRRVGNIIRGSEPRVDLDTQMVPILQFNYWTMRASHQMLLKAAHKSANWDTDLGALTEYYRQHAREEKHHDRWLKKDLESCGYIVGECPLIAASLIGTVMYAIEFIDPCALLGWQIIGECFSLNEYQLGILELAWGKPLLRTIRYHATHDKMHAAELMAMIDLLDPKRFEIVERIALATAHMFAAAMQEIAQCSPHVRA